MNPQRIAQLQALMVIDKTDPFLPYAVAQEYMSGEEWAEAAGIFAQVNIDFPEYLPAYYHYGLALVQLGNVNSAIQVLQAGMQLARQQKDFKTAAEIEALLEDLE
jgi:tetratricopeptide (TPR) repeat protein